MSNFNFRHATIETLQGAENYLNWSIKIEDMATELGIDEYIVGSKMHPPPKPAADATDAIKSKWQEQKVEWELASRKALARIRLTVGPNSMSYIRTCKTAFEAWDKLAKVYQPKGSLSLVQLRRKLFRSQCDSDDVDEHVRYLIDLRNQLSNYGETISEAEFASCILTSLPDSWDNWVSGIEMSKITDSDDIIARIFEQAVKRDSKPNSDGVVVGGTQLEPTDRILHAKNSRYHQNSPKPAYQSDYPKSKYDPEAICFNCGRIGHIRPECRDFLKGKKFTDQEMQDNFRNSRKFDRAHVATDLEPEDEEDFVGMSRELIF